MFSFFYLKSIFSKNTAAINRSIYDASIYQIKLLLEYKVIRLGGEYNLVNEAYTSQLCNNCRYKNEYVKDLNIREYTCECCNTLVNRDINAAKNILRFGHEVPQGRLNNIVKDIIQ